MSPMLKRVEKAGRRGISAKRRPNKVKVDDFFHDGETARKLFSKLIHSEESNRCVIIPSVSYGLANVAQNLPKKAGRIIVAEDQFPSNIYAWRGYKLVKVSKPAKGSWSEQIIKSIDSKTAAVCLSHVHWVDGSLFDLQLIGEEARKHGTALVIDATQSVGALPFDVRKIKPDALVVAGYKWLFGPYGIGMAYYGELFDEGEPIEQNWINRLGSEDFGRLVNYQENYQSGALRYEVGEHSNFVLLPMLIEAIKQIIKWSPEAIQEYTGALTSELISKIRQSGYLVDEEPRANHLFGIRFGDGIDSECVKKALAKHRVNVSFRGDAIRVAPHVYNDAKDIDKLQRALLSAVS